MMMSNLKVQLLMCVAPNEVEKVTASAPPKEGDRPPASAELLLKAQREKEGAPATTKTAPPRPAVPSAACAPTLPPEARLPSKVQPSKVTPRDAVSTRETAPPVLPVS